VCCTGPNAIVSLRLRDVARLVDFGFAHHITHERPKTPDTATWARKENDDSVFASMFPVLTRDVTGTCELLTQTRMCGAYPAWPGSCARYPYALDKLRMKIFYAKGCQSTRTMSADDAPDSVARILRAVVDAYNERIRDIVLVHTARAELEALGLMRFLALPEG
jgi:Fe-S-cluster containining protein